MHHERNVEHGSRDWYRPILELGRSDDTAFAESGGEPMAWFGPSPDVVCEVCDDNDHCLPRWEDDGGGID